MKSRDIKLANARNYHQDRKGYTKRCAYCHRVIYMLQASPGSTSYVPFESWVAGNVDEGSWIRHSCSSSWEDAGSRTANRGKSVATTEWVCSHCHQIMPRATADCHNCGNQRAC